MEKSKSMKKCLRSDKAAKHNEAMEQAYGPEIDECVRRSSIYGPVNTSLNLGGQNIIKSKTVNTSVEVTDEDSVTSIFRGTGTRQCVLNFASYTKPGGGFLSGSMAQEEALCHESILYNVLSRMHEFYAENKKHTNQGLYYDWAVYSPDIIFVRNGLETRCGVLTCPSPNWSAARNKGITKKKIQKHSEAGFILS